MSPAEAEALYHRLREIEVSDPKAREGFADTPEELKKARDALLAAGIICKHRQITPEQVKRFMVRLGNVVMQSKGPEYQKSCQPNDTMVTTCRQGRVEFSDGQDDDAFLCDISLRVYMDVGKKTPREEEGFRIIPDFFIPLSPCEPGRGKGPFWDWDLRPFWKFPLFPGFGDNSREGGIRITPAPLFPILPYEPGRREKCPSYGDLDVHPVQMFPSSPGLYGCPSSDDTFLLLR